MVSIAISSFRRIHAGSCVEEWYMQAGQSFASYLGWILFQATPAKNVWPPCPKSQVSAALLCLDHEVHVNTISVKTLHGLGVARHARPALLPLQPPSQ